MKAKKIGSIFASVLLLFTIFSGLSFSTAFAASTNPAADTGNPCSYPKADALFGLPTWYEYLPGITEQDGSCHPQLTNITYVWLIVLAVIDILLRLSGLIAVFMVIYGGVLYMTSMGSPDSTTRARKIIINSLVGLMITVMATFLVTFVAGIIH